MKKRPLLYISIVAHIAVFNFRTAIGVDSETDAQVALPLQRCSGCGGCVQVPTRDSTDEVALRGLRGQRPREPPGRCRRLSERVPSALDITSFLR